MKLLLARILTRFLARLAPKAPLDIRITEAVMLGICQGKVTLTVQKAGKEIEAQIPPHYARELGAAMMQAADIAEGYEGARVSETIQ